jgi:hypothetical protein
MQTMDQRNDTIREEHERLKRIHAEAVADQQWWESTLTDRRMKGVLETLDTETDCLKESLVSCDKKDIDGLQARVKANRALLERIKANGDIHKITEARRALDTFESENALFVHREGDAKPKAKTA